MLSSSQRFHGHGSLRFVYSKGKIVRARHFLVKITKNQRRQQSRYSVVVSKKVMKSAVGRNRIRRRMYESIRRHQAVFTQPVDVVLIVTSSEVAVLPAADIEASVRRVVEQSADMVK